VARQQLEARVSHQTRSEETLATRGTYSYIHYP
jgi:hypothetical protein